MEINTTDNKFFFILLAMVKMGEPIQAWGLQDYDGSRFIPVFSSFFELDDFMQRNKEIIPRIDTGRQGGNVAANWVYEKEWATYFPGIKYRLFKGNSKVFLFTDKLI